MNARCIVSLSENEVRLIADSLEDQHGDLISRLVESARTLDSTRLTRQQLTERVRSIVKNNPYESGDYQSYSENSEPEWQSLYHAMGLDGCYVGWESDGWFNTSLLIQLPSGSCEPIPDAFDEDGTSDELIDDCVDALFAAQEKYAPIMAKVRALFKECA